MVRHPKILDSSKSKLRITWQEKDKNLIKYNVSFNSSFLIRKSIIFIILKIRNRTIECFYSTLFYLTLHQSTRKHWFKIWQTKSVEILFYFYLTFTSMNKRVLIENMRKQNLIEGYYAWGVQYTFFSFLFEGNGIIGTFINICAQLERIDRPYLFDTKNSRNAQYIFIFQIFCIT